MVAYQGGKGTISKQLEQAILSHLPQGARGHYWEPFLGGGSMAARMGQHFDHAHYSDAHGPLILMWQAAQAGLTQYGDPGHFFPEDITEEDYDYHRASQIHSPATGLIGFGASFGGRYFQSYVGHDSSTGEGTRYQVARRGLVRKTRAMQGKLSTSYQVASYLGLEPQPGDVLYCDPPYADTTGYSTGAFDHATFWAWAKAQSQRGCHLYISAYKAPAGFTPIWEGHKRVTFNNQGNTRTAIERLWVPDP